MISGLDPAAQPAAAALRQLPGASRPLAARRRLASYGCGALHAHDAADGARCSALLWSGGGACAVLAWHRGTPGVGWVATVQISGRDSSRYLGIWSGSRGWIWMAAVQVANVSVLPPRMLRAASSVLRFLHTHPNPMELTGSHRRSPLFHVWSCDRRDEVALQDQVPAQSGPCIVLRLDGRGDDGDGDGSTHVFFARRRLAVHGKAATELWPYLMSIHSFG